MARDGSAAADSANGRGGVGRNDPLILPGRFRRLGQRVEASLIPQVEIKVRVAWHVGEINRYLDGAAGSLT